MKTRAIIQARMGSTRLKGKSLMKISGITLLERVVNNIKNIKFIDEVLVATTTLSEDDEIESSMTNLGISSFRGDQKNLLKRYNDASFDLAETDTVVRVTADNPFIVNSVAFLMYKIHIRNSLDYTCVENLSHITPEFIKVKALRLLNAKKNLSEYEKEHVTPFFRGKTNEFDVKILDSNFNILLSKYDKYLTLDSSKDLKRIKLIISELSTDQNFNIIKVYNWLEIKYGKSRKI